MDASNRCDAGCSKGTPVRERARTTNHHGRYLASRLEFIPEHQKLRQQNHPLRLGIIVLPLLVTVRAAAMPIALGHILVVDDFWDTLYYGRLVMSSNAELKLGQEWHLGADIVEDIVEELVTTGSGDSP